METAASFSELPLLTVAWVNSNCFRGLKLMLPNCTLLLKEVKCDWFFCAAAPVIGHCDTAAVAIASSVCVFQQRFFKVE